MCIWRRSLGAALEGLPENIEVLRLPGLKNLDMSGGSNNITAGVWKVLFEACALRAARCTPIDIAPACGSLEEFG